MKDAGMDYEACLPAHACQDLSPCAGVDTGEQPTLATSPFQAEHGLSCDMSLMIKYCLDQARAHRRVLLAQLNDLAVGIESTSFAESLLVWISSALDSHSTLDYSLDDELRLYPDLSSLFSRLWPAPLIWWTYCRIPGSKFLPPIPGQSQPQDLEVLIRHKERMRRFDCFMAYFRATHTQFQSGFDKPPDPDLRTMMAEDVSGTLRPHMDDFRRAFKDGLSAVRYMLAGSLPNALDAALGIAEVASAICKMLGEEETSTVSEDDFLSDLSRLRINLALADQAAYDYYTSLLWGDRPLKDVAWQGMLDGEDLEYLQDLLSKLLLDSGLERVDNDLAECEAAIQAQFASEILNKTSHSTLTEPTISVTYEAPFAPSEKGSWGSAMQSSLASSASERKLSQCLPLQYNFIMVAAGNLRLRAHIRTLYVSFAHNHRCACSAY